MGWWGWVVCVCAFFWGGGVFGGVYIYIGLVWLEEEVGLLGLRG